MPSAIGLRVYRFAISRRGETRSLPFDDGELNASVPEFVSKFISGHMHPVQNDEMERSWYFEQKSNEAHGNSYGYVHYGTFGFESNFVDAKTKAKQYRRQVTDVEEIPLFYEFWCPKKKAFGFCAFQSFQGRSCIGLVMNQMREAFERENPNHLLKFRKMLPNDATGSVYKSAPVTQLRLIKRSAPSDIADQYFDNKSPEPINFEVVMSARRSKSLGNFGSLISSVKSGDGSVIMHDGIEFTEAVALVRVGRRTRKVGVLGGNSDAGVIDLTDSIKRGKDGHPTFESLKHESDAILQDFFTTVAKVEN